MIARSSFSKFVKLLQSISQGFFQLNFWRDFCYSAQLYYAARFRAFQRFTAWFLPAFGRVLLLHIQCCDQNLHRKLGHQTKLYCFDIDNSLTNIFLFWNFCCLRQKAETFSICLKKHFVKPHKMNGLNELKFCEVSRNAFSKRC